MESDEVLRKGEFLLFHSKLIDSEVKEIREYIATSRANEKHIAKSLDEIRQHLKAIEQMQSEMRVNVGKLEAKSGVIASIAGALSGLISTKFGGGLGG